MPRATRAALRAQELAEEVASAASIALPPTPAKGRVPLGEISNNINADIEMAPSNDVHVGKEPAAKGKKGKGGKRGKNNAKAKTAPQDVEVLEDDDRSNHSDAVEQACNDLINNSNLPAPSETTLLDQNATPASPAVEEVVQQLSPNKSREEARGVQESMEAEISNGTHMAIDGTTMDHKQGGEQRTTPEQAQVEPTEDPLIDQINTRSSAKRISRIEDSVAAIDALEDEIDKIGEAIPAATSSHSSPTETRQKSSVIAKRKANGVEKASKTPVKPRISKPVTRPSAADLKPMGEKKAVRSPRSLADTRKTSQASVKTRGATAKRVSSIHKAPFQPTKSTKPPTKSNFELPGEAVARKLKEQREERKNRGPEEQPPKRASSVQNVPFQPTKSTKAPTVSNFELPGEAIAKKLKEQREERRKREEDEQAKKRQSKAKAVRTSTAPEVKLTAAARARLSMAPNASSEQSKPPLSSRAGKTSPTAAGKRQSSFANNRISSLHQPKRAAQPSVNLSAKRGPSMSASTLSHQASSLSQSRSGPTAEELFQQKTKGKEVFGRTRMMLSEKEAAKTAKEEAARKARTEAAERGRVASREWAQKQKVRKLAPQKEREEENKAGTA